MKISVIGKGKMGNEIIDRLIELGSEIVWVCRKKEDEDFLKSKYSKKLKKMCRRKKLSQKDYYNKMNNFIASSNYNFVSGSQYVIETVIEDLEVKKEIFEKVERQVDDECIFLTNTSSIPLEAIFENVKNKSRCLGLHFFYPLKIIKTVEINYLDWTDMKNVDKVRKLALSFSMEPILLHKEVNMLVSYIILILMAETYMILEEGILTPQELDQILKEDFMMMGAFEILNSTGTRIVKSCVDNFVTEDNKLYFDSFESIINKLSSEYDYISFGEYIQFNTQECKRNISLNKEKYKEDVLLRITSTYTNILTHFVLKKNVDKDELLGSMRSILGISKTPKDILEYYGIDNINKVLRRRGNLINCQIYKLEDLHYWMN